MIDADSVSDLEPADTAAGVDGGDILLETRGLTTYFGQRQGWLRRTTKTIRAVDGVDLTIRRGETLGLVGESGCGKSTVGRTILRIIEPTSGQVIFDGVDLSTLDGASLRSVRRRMQMIFQDPYASLDPRMSIGDIVAEGIDIHRLLSGAARTERIVELLETVGLDQSFVRRVANECSGGQRQRVGIARALAVEPDFVVADEPISALDVSIQAQVINLFEHLQERFGLTYLFVAHDLSIVRHISDRVAVMYLGKVVELAGRQDLFERPLHPYTQALLSAVPIPDPKVERHRKRMVLTGDVPSAADLPTGCRFRTRCWKAQSICSEVEPSLIEHAPAHAAACHFPDL